MLQDKYTFKRGYNEWGVLCNHIKNNIASLAGYRPKSTLQASGLLWVSVLRDFNIRLDRKLCSYKSQTSFTLKQSEAIAVYLAYRNGFIPQSELVMEIVTAIDRNI